MDLLFDIESDRAPLDRPDSGQARCSVDDLLHHLDWTTSPLGHPADWSVALKTLMATVLPTQAQIVLFWGPQFVALYNDAYTPTIGTKHPRAFGRPAIENWSELWDDLEPLLRGVYESGQTFSAKDRPFYIERHGLGETAYFDISYSAVREVDGAVGGVLCIVTETTERVQFERRQAFLLELGQALPSIVEPDAIEATAVYRLADVLGASRVFFGEDNADGVSFSVYQDHSPGLRSAVGVHRYRDFGDGLLASLQAGQSISRSDLANESGLSIAEATLCADLDLAATLYVPVVRHGALEAMLAIHYQQAHAFTDCELRLAQEAAKLIWGTISHARAEAALRANSAQMSAMFDQTSAGIAVCDSGGRFTRVNDRYCEIVGRTREALLGLRMRDILHPDDRHAHQPAAERSHADLVPLEITQRYARPDGSPVWVQEQITPLMDAQGDSTSTLCVCMDISARMRAEAELRELNESLEERVTAIVAQREAAVAQLHEARKMETIGQLTGGIAHDFNNLLTPIMGTLDLIRRRLDDERSRNLVDGALQTADRARILVGRLLTFARRQTLKPSAVTLETLVNDMQELISRSLGPTIEVVISIPGRLPAVIVDAHQLELAVLNLALNARDAMSDGGRLKISAAVDVVPTGRVKGLSAGRYVCLIVDDNGHGMDEDTLQRCAEPFFSTKGVGKGTGLGLSMAQGLAAQSGGGLGITSEVGRGTQVSIWLPITEEHAQNEGAEPDDVPQAPRPALVLLVDDEEIVRRTTALQLQDLGYLVSEAASAAAALQMLDDGLVPDVLVTDHIMPEKSGIQLAHELRQRMPGLPILVTTGYSNLSPAQMHDFDMLAKPFRRAEIAARLLELLRNAG
ncbi:PAS domain S-box protein [Pseudomonas sp. Gutcm_11s]|uniref:PAS domain S-box protein n=1 Tax=Pseudomonas sp. Gutcm_11s TaxID=3026088 RepID=UPI002362C944|nr:PAS domain S-box protein [Pseudomonas sp. Gutcm_11s]MDD0843803.1 PAS domain-containing protein [Pseudomonas sp. Gutcm_11s]